MSCLQFIMQHLKSRLPGYMICIVPPAFTSPPSHGSPICRPREYLLGLRRGAGHTSDESEFSSFMHSVVKDINAIAFGLAASRGITSFLDVLSEPKVASGLAPVGYSPCGCVVMSSCPLHPCMSRDCQCAIGQVCDWRKVHSKAWRELGIDASREAPYFKFMASRGIDVGSELRSPRQRDLINLMFLQKGTQGRAMCAVFDVSQSLGRCQFRADGRLPTLTTTSRIFPWV